MERVSPLSNRDSPRPSHTIARTGRRADPSASAHRSIPAPRIFGTRHPLGNGCSGYSIGRTCTSTRSSCTRRPRSRSQAETPERTRRARNTRRPRAVLPGQRKGRCRLLLPLHSSSRLRSRRHLQCLPRRCRPRPLHRGMPRRLVFRQTHSPSPRRILLRTPVAGQRPRRAIQQSSIPASSFSRSVARHLSRSQKGTPRPSTD
jgi:hypothetical protein